VKDGKFTHLFQVLVKLACCWGSFSNAGDIAKIDVFFTSGRNSSLWHYSYNTPVATVCRAGDQLL
jgi:hypothetical protein